jgi:CheY-like chemotaxis protein
MEQSGIKDSGVKNSDQAKSKKVMVVEDDAMIRASLVELLEGEGYEVIGVENGQAAMNYLKSSEVLPGVILLDVMMPIMDGWQFRTQQLSDSKISKIPVIVVTADGNAQDKADVMSAQGWVNKPFKIDDILESVAKHMAE